MSKVSEHENLLKDAKESIDKVFGDTSVSRKMTKDSLVDLLDYIRMSLDALEDR
jgi:hypothetical protein